MKNLPFDITIFFITKNIFHRSSGFYLHPMYSFLSCTVFFHLLFPLFSLLLLFLLSSFHVIFPAICFLLFSLFLVFPPPLFHLYTFLTFYLLTPPHTSFASLSFSRFFPVYLFLLQSIIHANSTFFLFSVCLSRFSICCFSS